MKKSLFLGAALIAATIGTAFTLESDPESLAIGEKAPMTDYKMMDIQGEAQTLARLAGEEGLCVIFSCNTCPFVVGREGKSEGWEGRYNEVYKMAQEQNIGVVLVNSNEAKREGVDSMKEMQMRAKTQGYKMPYVVDKDHALADAFGARTTPHVYLFDADMTLVYKGAIDDNVDAAKDVKEPWLINAMRAVANDENIEPNSTKPIGCSIKRVQ